MSLFVNTVSATFCIRIQFRVNETLQSYIDVNIAIDIIHTVNISLINFVFFT